jgi:hypothetical protein
LVFAEPRPRQAGGTALAIRQQVEARRYQLGEELRAPTSAVKDHGQSPLSEQGARLVEERWQHFHQPRVGFSGHDEKGFADGVVDPVVRGRGHGQAHPCDMGFGQGGLTVEDAHVSIDVEKPHPGATRRDPAFGQCTTEPRGTLQFGHALEFASQGLDLRCTIQSENAAQGIGGVFFETFWPLDP